MNDKPRRELAVFDAALKISAAERPAFLVRECGDDHVLIARVEALLKANAKAGDFMEDSPGGSQLRSISAIGERPGDRLGRYKLLQQIGEGGCGVVFMAEQEEPVRRKVALKIIKPGMDTRSVIARFEAERQALAMMDHPSIAKVFDAGATGSGRPYFVMELIRGAKITNYCDQNSLSTRERLELFVQVCQAIQHAHQKGLIHRDIKPSNILVTTTEQGVAHPVVIDFGIAKATTNQKLTDKTLFTAFEMLIGTPAYMSPEQAAIVNVDVDTRTDIYSLGVLLYELLTSSTPFDAAKLLQAGLDEIRRVIREVEPARPSNCLSTMAGPTLTTVAQQRHSAAPDLIHAIRGDLDWIVMKALEKDRTRRYETAIGLALDVKRSLANEPVSARPPSSAYRLQKMIHRNKLAFGAAAAVLAALVAGIVISTGQMMAARKAQQETEAARNDERQRRIEAQAAEMRAQAQTLAVRRISYSSDMNAAQQALKDNNLGRARMLLSRQKPQAGELDLRDWEWRYLWSQARADDHDVFSTGPRWSTRPLSFSFDGRMLVREFKGRSIATDLISRHVVWEQSGAWLPVFAHRGNRLVYVSKDPAKKQDIITILDFATKKEIQPVRSANSTEWIGFTPDDRQLLTVSVRPGTIRTEVSPAELTAWEADTGKLLWQRTIGGRPPWAHWRSYTISQDGTAFAAALPGGQVQVIKIADGSDRFTVAVTEEMSICVKFSPDSSTLLTGAGFSDSTIRLWDAHSGEARGTMEGHNAFITDLLFTPDGSQLISSSGDQTIRLWDWTTRKPVGMLRGHQDAVDGMALSPDGRNLASRCQDGSTYLWDLTKASGHLGYQVLPSRLMPGPHTAQFTPDSRSIVGFELNGDVAVWDTQTAKETRHFTGIPINKTAAISPDAKWIGTSNERRDKLSFWDAASGMEITHLDFTAPKAGLADWKFIDGGKLMVTVSGSAANAVLESWNLPSWQRKDSVSLHFKTLLDYSANFEPKSFSLLDTYAVKADGVFHLFDVTSLHKAPRVFKSGFAAGAWTGTLDGRMTAAADSSGMVRLWDVKTLRTVVTLKSFRLGAHSVAFSPDSRRLAAGSNGQEAVRLWDVETWQEVLTLSGEGSRISGLKFSPDGRHLLAINDAGLTHLWTAPTWEEIAAEEAKGRPASVFDGNVNGVKSSRPTFDNMKPPVQSPVATNNSPPRP